MQFVHATQALKNSREPLITIPKHRPNAAARRWGGPIMGDPWPRLRSWIADAAAAVAKAAAAGGARREVEEEDEAPGRRPVRRQRGRHGRRGLPVLVVACLALLLVALALLGGAAEAKRAPPADSISVQIRKPRGSGGNGNGSGNGKKGPAAQGGNGEAGADDVGPVAAAGDGAGGAAAGGRSMGMGGGETAAPDFLGRLTCTYLCLDLWLVRFEMGWGGSRRIAPALGLESDPGNKPASTPIHTPTHTHSVPGVEALGHGPRAALRVAQAPHHQGPFGTCNPIYLYMCL